jgi:hypothetical protein
MKSLSSFTTPPGFKLLQLGQSGVGKSHRALDIALRYGPVLVLDYDKNISRMFQDLKKKDALDKVLLCDDAVMYGYAEFEKFFKAEASKKDLSYASVLIDTATFLSDAFYEELTKHSYFGNPSNTLKLYGELGARMTKAVKLIGDLPVNFIINAHEKLLDNGSYDIIGKGSSADVWSKMFGEKHRLITRPKSLVPRVKGAMSDGLVTSRTDLLDADGFFKDAAANELFDEIAYKR